MTRRFDGNVNTKLLQVSRREVGRIDEYLIDPCDTIGEIDARRENKYRKPPKKEKGKKKGGKEGISTVATLSQREINVAAGR